MEIYKINNNANASGNILSTLVKLKPFRIFNAPIKKLSIKFEPKIDFKNKIKIIK